MQLSKNNIDKIEVKNGLEIPDKKVFGLPEKVLQFGTGVLLRALPDHLLTRQTNRVFLMAG